MTRETRQIVKDEIAELNSIQPYSYKKYIKFANMIIAKHPLSYFSLLSGKRFSSIWNDILEKTSFIDSHFSPKSATRIFYYVNKLTELKRCETCNKELEKDISPVNHYEHFFCCNRCAQLHESTIAKTKATKLKNHGDSNYNNMEKTRATCKERFGVECSFQAEEVQEKSRQSIKEHFGVDHQMHSQEVKDKMKARYKEQHGVEYSFQDPEVQTKINAKNQEKLGVDWPMQSKELHKIIHENSTATKKRNYFNDVILNYNNVEPLFNEEDFMHTTGRFYRLKWKCKKCGNEFEQDMFRHGFEPRCFKCKPLLTDFNSSNAEKELVDFINSVEGSRYECINGDILNWTTLSGKRQLDIICRRKDNEKIDLAFEFNGLYWHQTKEKPKRYHLEKTLECEKLGIRLVHVWEDEWKCSNELKKFIELLLKDEYFLVSNDEIIELDRSKVCRLQIPACYEIIEETLPNEIERHDSRGNTYLVEDCGKLICRKIT